MRPLRVAHHPGFDAIPTGVAHQALVEQPAAHALIGLAIGPGKGQAHPAVAAIGLLHPHLARALDVQNKRIDRVGQPGDLLPGQGRAGLGQGVELLAGEPRPALALGLLGGGRKGVQGHTKARPGLACGIQLRLVVAGEQALRGALQRLDAVGLQAGDHPQALLAGVGNAQAAHVGAQTAKHGAWALTVFQPRVPGLVQAVVLPTWKIVPRHWRPTAFQRQRG